MLGRDIGKRDFSSGGTDHEFHEPAQFIAVDVAGANRIVPFNLEIGVERGQKIGEVAAGRHKDQSLNHDIL